MLPVSFQSPTDDQPQHGEHGHEPEPDRQGRRPPPVRNIERGSRDHDFVRRELVGRVEHQDQEGEGSGNRQDVEKGPRPRSQHSDDCGHSHVLGTLKRQHGAQHREPEKEDSGKFVRPDDRLLEQIAGGNARKEHDDLRDHKRSRGDPDERPEESLDLSRGACRARGGERRADVHLLHDLHGRYPMLPAYFCSSAQASLPNLALASL